MRLDTTDFILLLGLFVILSPGLILTIPGLSQTNIDNKGVAYLASSGTVQDCSASTTTEDECKKPAGVLATGYTNGLAIFIHTLIFAALLYLLPGFIGLAPFNTTTVIIFAGLFALLSPGLILTLPPLSPSQCGESNNNIADTFNGSLRFCQGTAGTDRGIPVGTKFTNALYPNCYKCQSWWVSGSTGVVPILVHAVVFGLLVWIISRYYL